MAESTRIKRLLGEGKATEALSAAKDAVRSEPGDLYSRIALCELLALFCDWNRVIDQAAVVRRLGDENTADLLASLARAELERRSIFSGEGIPVCLPEISEPEWFGPLAESFRAFSTGNIPDFKNFRRAALLQVRQFSVGIDECQVERVGDGDERLGPCLECILQGRYHWLPISEPFSITFSPPTSVRDLIWRPAAFVRGGKPAVFVFIPARFDMSFGGGISDSLLLGRETFWNSETGEAGIQIGVGQKVLSTEAEDIPIMSISGLSVSLQGH